MNQKSNKRESVNMAEIARLAEVSVSTVSHVVNKTRFVSEEKKDKIQNIINKFNYKPNMVAQGLRGKKIKLIGLLISEIKRYFSSALVGEIVKYASLIGYNVIVCNSEQNVDKEKYNLDVLLQKGIDGLIYSPIDNKASIDILASKHIHFVQIDRKNDKYNSDYVGIDNFKYGQTAVSYLLAKGCKQIGFIGYEERDYTNKIRLKGFIEACSNSNIFDKSLIKIIDYNDYRAAAKIKEWYLKNKSIDGIICGNANICYLVLLMVEELGIRVPFDVNLISFDYRKWFHFLKYPIAAIKQPIENIAKTATELLIKRIDENEFPVRDIMFDCEIVETDFSLPLFR